MGAKISFLIMLFTIFPFWCFATDSVTQEAYGENSQNIVANNVNVTGLARKQYEELLKLYENMNNQYEKLNLQYDKYKIEKSRNLQKIDELVSQIYVNVVSKANDEDFLDELNRNFDAIEQKNRLIEEGIEKENIDRINYSASVVKNVSFLFDGLVSHVNSKMRALEGFEKVDFLYQESSGEISFFKNGRRGVFSQISKTTFSDKSVLKIFIKSGSVENGIVKSFPMLTMSTGSGVNGDNHFKITAGTRKKGTRLISLVNRAYMKEKKREWGALFYYPEEEKIIDEIFYDELSSRIVEIVTWFDHKSKE